MAPASQARTKQNASASGEQHARERGAATRQREQPLREPAARAPARRPGSRTALPRMSAMRPSDSAPPCVGGLDDAGHHRQDHEAQHVVDHRGAQDDAGLAGLRLRSRSSSTRAVMPDAGGGQRRAQEGVHVARSASGRSQRADRPAQREGRDHAEHRHQERRQPDREHLRDGGLEPDLEQQEQHADLGEHVDGRVVADRLEPGKPSSARLPSRMPTSSSPSTAGWPEARGQVAAQLGADEDDREKEDHRCDRIGVLGRGLRVLQQKHGQWSRGVGTGWRNIASPGGVGGGDIEVEEQWQKELDSI